MNRTTAGSIRARVRSQIVQEIKDVARRQLAQEGAAALSLRQVAREMEMVSSAIYRYFPSRDDLLTALIVDAYDALGGVVEAANADMAGDPSWDRWLGICRTVRTWAITHRDEYALIYGSPVPGYRAPEGTIPPAARVALVILGVLRDALTAGDLQTSEAGEELPPRVRADVAQLRASSFPDLPEDVLAKALLAWTQLLGAISLELFGHLHNVIKDYEAFFDYQMSIMAGLVGLTPTSH